MEANISSFRELVGKFFRKQEDSVPVVGKWTFEITRADGKVEIRKVKNTLTSEGLNMLAQRGITNTGSAFIYMAVGTQTAASSLGSTQAGLGEVVRKALSTAAGSNEVMVGVATLGGASDSLTSLDLRTAGLANHASSGSGIMLNFVNSVATILANSDIVKIQVEVQVGSHAL